MIIIRAVFISLLMIMVASSAEASSSITQECRSQAAVKWDTGITSEMIEGNALYEECLYTAIHKELKMVMQDDKQVESMLSDLRLGVDSVVKAQYALENENKLCAPSCGTMWHVTPAASGHAILEEFLKSINGTKEAHQ